MAVFRWPNSLDPWSGLRQMQRELERLMGRAASDSRSIGGGIYPPVNVLNGSDDLIVQCEVAGVSKDDLDISITGDTLVIRGRNLPSADEQNVRFQRRERGSGDFSRTIVLPDKVDTDRVEANLKDGILTIRLSKTEAAKPRQIRVS